MPLADSHVVVLAAGRGSRMGIPKAAMLAQARPWALVQQERLAGLGVNVAWVLSGEAIAALGAAAGSLEPRVITDADAPMFESLRAGVASITPERRGAGGVFVLPIDVPVPGIAVWAALRERATVAAPVHSGCAGHPIYLPWRDAAAWVESAPPGSRLDELLRPRRVLIPTDDPRVAMNLNTPEQLRAFLGLAPPDEA